MTETSKDVRLFRDAWAVAADYASPYFTLAARLYGLWKGKIPDVVNTTFSKIMLNIAHAAVQDRIPSYLGNMFPTSTPISLQVREPLMEPFIDAAESWVNDLMTGDDKLAMPISLTPAMQGASICGTAYRMPCVHMTDEGKAIITGKDVDFFQLVPSPNGGQVNPMFRNDECAVDWFFTVDWWTNDQIMALSKLAGFQKDAVEKLLKTKPGQGDDNEVNYTSIYNIIGGVSYASKNDWRTRLASVEGLNGRRKVTFWFKRDAFWIVAQDSFLIYKGPAVMHNGLLPLAKYCITPDFNNWFGISLLEMIEDIIIAMLMNFNYRFDFMANSLFPAKYIREDVMGDRPVEDFASGPYNLFKFPSNVSDIRQALYFDRAPEIAGQTFMDEDRLKAFMQDISGMPNYAKGQPSQGTLENRTATGLVSLIRHAEGRLNAESMQMEYFGLAQEARLYLALADMHITTPQLIRNAGAGRGGRWTRVDPDILGNFYNVRTNGTRFMAERDTTFQKIMALYPLWNNDPMINQINLRKQLGDRANIFDDLNQIVNPEGTGPAMGAPPPPDQLGGFASAQDLNQPARGMRNRTTVRPGGQQAPSSPTSSKEAATA